MQRLSTDQEKSEIYQKEEKNFTTEQKLDEHTCPLCLNVLYNPIITPCKHAFCYYCFEECQDLAIKQNSCPLCRAKIKDSFKLVIDKDYQEKLVKLLPKETQATKKYFDDFALLLEKEYIKIKLEYGNTHKLIENPRKLRSSTNYENKHAWGVYVKVASKNCEDDSRKYISKVEFEMHPTFSERIVPIKAWPFKLERVGWGLFNVPIKVFFNKKEVIGGPLELNHLLDFDGEGEKKFAIAKLRIKKSTLETTKNTANVGARLLRADSMQLFSQNNL